MDKNYFEELNALNVSDKVEKKNGLSYLSWAYAWGELKKRHPVSNYRVFERADGVNYWTDGKTAWVKVGVTVGEIEHVEYLPVMDFRNASIPLDKITSFDVNKAIQRALTKAIARHGLGLYIYAGEDIPSDDNHPSKMTDNQQMDWVAKIESSVNMADLVSNYTASVKACRELKDSESEAIFVKTKDDMKKKLEASK